MPIRRLAEAGLMGGTMGRTRIGRATRLALVVLAAAGMAIPMAGCVPQRPVEDDRFTRESVLEEPTGQEKPVLYLYPDARTDVSVRIADPSLITASYPEYAGGWRVTAYPGGTLADRETGRSLYALYYEARSRESEQVRDEGFVVGRDDLIPFLEGRLGLLGLTEREAEEMIVYWLPRMQANDACYVRFSLTGEEQRQNSFDIDPAPDHLIRIRMVWKGLDAGEAGKLAGQVEEQEFSPVARESLDGFVAVEWGGTEIGSGRRS